MLNATGYFQVVLTRLKDDLNCKVRDWADDVVFWGHDPMELIDTWNIGYDSSKA